MPETTEEMQERWEAGVSEDLAEIYSNHMWDCVLEIVDGENSYNDHYYFMGSLEDASKYISSVAATYFRSGSKETIWEPKEGCYYNRPYTRTCHALLPTEFKEIAAMTKKGTFTYSANWSLK